MRLSRRNFGLRGAIAAAVLFGVAGIAACTADEAPRVVPPPATDEAPHAGLETAVLAGGCFWGVEGVYQHVKGVQKVLAGYSGGAASTATYEQVGTETTGHAESVQITFDPKVVTYGRLLQIFFSVAHDPTELNHQGPDSGTSYRSNIFTASDEQMRVATAYVAQLNAAKVYSAPIVTRVDPSRASTRRRPITRTFSSTIRCIRTS